ncbi:unnamed protein product [Gordionus sp. m RMFG-2023]
MDESKKFFENRERLSPAERIYYKRAQGELNRRIITLGNEGSKVKLSRYILFSVGLIAIFSGCKEFFRKVPKSEVRNPKDVPMYFLRYND